MPDASARLEDKLTALLAQCEDDERTLLLEILEAAADAEVEGFDAGSGQATGKRQHLPFAFTHPAATHAALSNVLKKYSDTTSEIIKNLR